MLDEELKIAKQRVNRLYEISSDRKFVRKRLLIFLRKNSYIVSKWTYHQPFRFCRFSDSRLIEISKRLIEHLDKQ